MWLAETVPEAYQEERETTAATSMEAMVYTDSVGAQVSRMHINL